MQASDVYHTQGIRGFHVKSTAYLHGEVVVRLEFPSDHVFCCPCGNRDVKVYQDGERTVTGLPSGKMKVRFVYPSVRVDDCSVCGKSARIPVPFVWPHARHTRAVERSVIELRREMSIKAVANFYGIDWRTVKDIEKRHLQTKFRRIRLKDVRVIGIDEIHVGKEGFKTIVRDLQSGAVLFVGKGKGEEALKPLERRIKSSRAKIKLVAMDMAAGFEKWVRRVLSKAEIVFDHFHLIKLMNDKLNQLRRKTMAEMDDETRKELKNKRKLFLRNEEELEPEDKTELERIKKLSEELSTAHAMKEQLRSIYSTAKNTADARLLLRKWIRAARASTVACLKTMANTIEKHLEGILVYWKTKGLTSAGMEGFNNKIRWLIRQAYGFHDQEYFELKIYDLPTCKTAKEI